MEPAPPEPLSFPPHMWRISRLSARLILDVAEVSRAGGDMLDPLLVSTITEANVAPINQDPELQRRYAGLGVPPPDALRRPISIAALARSLGLPFETVRRRVRHLAEAGVCVTTRRGVIVPAAVHAGPAYAEQAVRRYELAWAFYLDLQAAGVLPANLPEPEGPPLADAPVRAVNRLLSEYFLRVTEGG